MNVCLPFLPTEGAGGAVDGEGGSDGQAGVHTHGREQGWESLGAGSQEGVRRLLRSSKIARQVRRRCPKDFSLIDAGYIVGDMEWRGLFFLYQRLTQIMLSTPNYGLTCLYISNWRWFILSIDIWYRHWFISTPKIDAVSYFIYSILPISFFLQTEMQRHRVLRPTRHRSRHGPGHQRNRVSSHVTFCDCTGQFVDLTLQFEFYSLGLSILFNSFTEL